MSHPYVYKLTDKHTGHFYIGVRYANKVSPEKDLGVKYFTSSLTVKQRGFDNFASEIIAVFDNKMQAVEHEARLIDENWNDPLLLNKHNKGVKFRNDTPRPEWLKEHLSIINKGKKTGPMSQEHKEKISAANKGKTIANGRKPLDEKTKQKMSLSKKGLPIHFPQNVKCNHCNKIMNAGNHARFHGDKCKSIRQLSSEK